MFIIGGRVINVIGQDCTHVLVDQNMPLINDLIDAVVARKPLLLKSWVEVWKHLILYIILVLGIQRATIFSSQMTNCFVQIFVEFIGFFRA